jgi:hypothetical protein
MATPEERWRITTTIAVITAVTGLVGLFVATLAVPEFHDWVFSKRPGGQVHGVNPSAPNDAGPPLDGSMQVPPDDDPNVQPAIPANYVLAGSPDIEQYCQQWWGGRHAVLRYQNTWGYRCADDSTSWPGNRVGDLYISMTDACDRFFGASAVDHYANYRDPSTWQCFAAT